MVEIQNDLFDGIEIPIDGIKISINEMKNTIDAVCDFMNSPEGEMLLKIAELAARINPALRPYVLALYAVATVCRLLKPEEKIEDKGEVVLQAAEKGITLESCNNDFEEYKKKIEEFEIDPTIKHSEDECFIAGASYLIKGIEESSPYLRNFSEVLALCCAGKDNAVISDFFNEKRIETYSKLATDMRFDIGKISSYFEGTLTTSEFDKVDNFLHTAEKQLDPNYTEKDFDKTILTVTDEIKKLEK